MIADLSVLLLAMLCRHQASGVRRPDLTLSLSHSLTLPQDLDLIYVRGSQILFYPSVI
jgi:hypothetical protein